VSSKVIILRIKLDGLRYDCARTSLTCTCRWLGNFKRRVLEAEMFENLTTSQHALVSRTDAENSSSHELELAFFKQLAADPLRIQKEIEQYNLAIPVLTKKLAQVEPKTKLLREIDSSFQTFLRRDDSQIYSRNQSVADLELLFQRVKASFFHLNCSESFKKVDKIQRVRFLDKHFLYLARIFLLRLCFNKDRKFISVKVFFARFVSKHRIARFAPPQMISQLGDDQIVQLSKQFGKVINELDFESMLDYDEYSRDGASGKGPAFSMRLD
jgi:hypothetical protein